jgi:hypothetical protein
MSDFGDFDDDDALDHEPADPEQVAIKIHQLRRREGLELYDWPDLANEYHARSILAITALLAWMRRQGAH